MYHAFYSDGTNILKLYDCSTFTPKILLYVKTLQKLELTIKQKMNLDEAIKAF